MGVLGGVLKDLWQRIRCHEKGKKRREWKSEECLENPFILLQRREKFGGGLWALLVETQHMHAHGEGGPPPSHVHKCINIVD